MDLNWETKTAYFSADSGIYRCNLDLSGLVQLRGGTADRPGIAVDVETGEIYWTEDLLGAGALHRSDLQGEGGMALPVLPSAGRPYRVAVAHPGAPNSPGPDSSGPCAAFNLVLERHPTAPEVTVGQVLTIPLTIRRRYGCASTDVRVEMTLPPGLEWESWVGSTGIASVNGGHVVVKIGLFDTDSVLEGQLKLRAVTSGFANLTVRVVSFESRVAGEDARALYSVLIKDPEASGLSIHRRADGYVVISWPAQKGIDLESSSGLGEETSWSPVAATEVEGRAMVAVDPSGERSYYRLKRSD